MIKHILGFETKFVFYSSFVAKYVIQLSMETKGFEYNSSVKKTWPGACNGPDRAEDQLHDVQSWRWTVQRARYRTVNTRAKLGNQFA